MKFQTVKNEQTIQAEKIFREIVQNCVQGNDYILVLRDKENEIEKLKFPKSFILEEEYPIVVLDKKKNLTSWNISRTLLNLPDNETLYNKYHTLKRSIDFVFVGNGDIQYKRDKKKWVDNREGIDLFSLGCRVGFELVLTCDVDNDKYNDLDEYNIKPIYRVDTLELIKVYNKYQEQDAIPNYIPVSKIL